LRQKVKADKEDDDLISDGRELNSNVQFERGVRENLLVG
jgi:hypothetical protein